MSKEEINVLQWQKNFAQGLYEANDFDTQVKAGWYDWFCKTTSLKNKTYNMGRIISQVKQGGKVDLENSYVWFKNNCPCSAPLYDDFRFADIKTGDTLLTIECGHPWKSNYTYRVYGRKNDFNKPLFECYRSVELIKWLNTPWED